jgi:hypothetical protein
MIKTKGQPISGGAKQFRPTPNVLTDAATSRDAQQLTRSSPQPFQSRQSTANLPAGRLNMKTLGIPYDKPSPVKARPQNWGKKPEAGTSASMLAAVGEPRVPKGYNSINSGYPTRGTQRTVGGGNFPKATASQRAKYPGIFGR